MQEMKYVGNELELFQHAKVWKKYFGKLLKPYLKGRVLEVGAGLGSTTEYLCDGTQSKWVCMEPDPNLYSQLHKKIEQKELPSACIALKAVITDLPLNEKFDAIVYIDVIEHIEDDKQELKNAEQLLASDGYLLVLVPAHQFVYSAFDKSIGHFRRYNKKLLVQTAPSSLQLEKIFYLDSIGLLASIANKYSLKQNYPTMKQVNFWDRFLVRISKFTDFVIGYQTGKTLVAIWKKP
jgi:ubiquinone/menaquinone biosynthesis C-methylase UbiE